MKINSKTTLCCVIGNPIEHSLSPAMHNTGYQSLGLNYAYVAFRVENVKDAISGIRGLGIRGVSVTIPHKISVMPYLDKIDQIAKDIGAVNTILNDGGRLAGYNTDCEGAIRALKEVTDLKNKKVIILGAGGASRAIVFGLKKEDAKILILSRNITSAEKLATEAGVNFGDLDSLTKIKNSDILINATPVGMHPNTDNSLVPKEYLHKNLVVFDVVYNPKETKLIKDAKKKQCKIAYGYKMLLYQAVTQFELFTKTPAPVKIMEKELLDSLKRKG